MASIINAATSGGLVTTADTSGILQLQTAGTTGLTLNASLALGVGSGNSTGTNGQVLTSAGSGSAPTWAAAGASLTTPSFTTTIGVGSATASASGAGITFPVTQSASSDANTLDDYEEGTWTPSVTLNTGTATAYTIVTAYYTKTGRMVVLLGSIIPTNGTFGSAGGYIRLTGLPFVPSGRVGIGSGGNSSNLNNGVSTTFAYMASVPTLDATFESSVTNANEWAFISTFFV
jgi:hypothetical protein